MSAWRLATSRDECRGYPLLHLLRKVQRKFDLALDLLSKVLIAKGLFFKVRIKNGLSVYGVGSKSERAAHGVVENCTSRHDFMKKCVWYDGGISSSR